MRRRRAYKPTRWQGAGQSIKFQARKGRAGASHEVLRDLSCSARQLASGIASIFSSLTPEERADVGEGVALIGRWHDKSSRSGVAILESDDAAAVQRFTGRGTRIWTSMVALGSASATAAVRSNFLVDTSLAERWIRLLISDVSGRNPSTVRGCLGRRSGRSWDRKLAWIAHRPSQPREASFVVMGFQLWTFDKGATRFDDAPNVERLGPSLQRVVRSAWAARRRAIREGHGSRDAFVQADVAAFISTFMRIG